MVTTWFVKKLIRNALLSLVGFAFIYVKDTFKTLCGKPFLISQIRALLRVAVPVALYMILPLRVIICAYIVIAMLSSFYDTYQQEMDWEKIYHYNKSQERLSYYSDNQKKNENNESKREDSSQSTEKASDDYYENKEPQTEKNEGYVPFSDDMTLEEAKEHYHHLMKMAHPDNDGDEAFTKFITAEYQKFCQTH